MPFIRELLDAYQISRYELEQYEADDIIGTLAKSAEKDGFEVKVFSGDKDLTQLATDKRQLPLRERELPMLNFTHRSMSKRNMGLRLNKSLT